MLADPEVEDWLPERVQLARKVRSLTQPELALKTGLAQSAISEIEAGRRKVSSAEARKLADGLDVPRAMFYEDRITLTLTLDGSEVRLTASVPDPLLNGSFQRLEERARLSSVRFSRVTSSGNQLKLVAVG
jgi:transcriptional regulator with XRE-family HTH domain